MEISFICEVKVSRVNFADFEDESCLYYACIMLFQSKHVFNDLLDRLRVTVWLLDHLHDLRMVVPLRVLHEVCFQLDKLRFFFLNERALFVSSWTPFESFLELPGEHVELQACSIVKVKDARFLSN